MDNIFHGIFTSLYILYFFKIEINLIDKKDVSYELNTMALKCYEKENERGFLTCEVVI